MCALLLPAFLLEACQRQDVSETEDWINIDRAAGLAIQDQFDGVAVVETREDEMTLQIPRDKIADVSRFMHDQFHRCGGYFGYSYPQEARAHLYQPRGLTSTSWTIRHQEQVTQLITHVNSTELVSTISALEAFHNRYYTATTGVASQEWVRQKWQGILADIPNATVSFYEHSRWAQPSVVATIPGTVHPEEIVILGGHADSIGSRFDSATARAPGADDNASGIATLTEAMRVLVGQGFSPQRTIQFMAYAAEEVGLRGSREIAEAYRTQGKNVVAVLQLDMTNYPTVPVNISVIRDHTDDGLSLFVGQLIETYLPGVVYDDDRCGYACSDHASWTSSGFPSAIPFETPVDDYNPQIHTRHDTLANADPTGAHATMFGKIAVAFAVEVSAGE